MAKIIACDICGKQSPDENGCYPHGEWLDVKIQDLKDVNRYVDTSRTFLICRECARVDYAWRFDREKEKSLLQRIVELFVAK
jgi:hypothetical protein